MPINTDRRKSTHRTINRNSLIIWLFFITFAINLAVFLVVFEINNTLRLLILAESRFKGHYYNAVISLKTYLDSRSESDFQDYKAHLVPLYLFKNAQDELNKPNLDFRHFSNQMMELKFGYGDIFRVTLFFRTVRNSEFFKVSKNIMQEGSGKVQSLDMIGEYFHQNLNQNPVDQIGIKENIDQLKELDRRMENFFSEFSDKINDLYLKLTLISEIATSSIGILLLFFGIYASRKIIEKSEIDRKALERSEAGLRLSMEQMPASIWTADPSLKITTLTGAAMIDPASGGKPLVGRSIPSLLERYPQKELVIEKHLNALKGESGQYEILFGERFWTAHVEPFRDRNGLITGILGIAYDITERKNQESILITEKERLLVTLRSIGDAVITTDKEGRITLMNPVAQELSGWSQAEAVGKFLPEVFHIYNELTGAPVENPVSKVILTGQTVALANHTVLKSKEGMIRSIADSGAPIQDAHGSILGVVLVFRDVTQEMKIQNELLKKMKLDSLGLLAGGIAHDFNNILTAILGNISLAKTELDPGLPAIRYLNETETATLKARDLSSQLLAFTKGGAPQKKITSISRLVEESTRFVLRGSNIRSVFYFPDNLWLGEFDSGQIAQVVHNLVINAKQAMSDGGEIIISAANTNIEEPRATALLLDAGPYVAITFKDNGKGIPSDQINRVFDPFFTTKEKGSGLGLFSAYSVVKNHNGTIGIESKVGLGTSITLYLPAIIKNLPPEENQSEKIFKGSGRILLMDDDEFVRSMASEMLKKLGYDVELVAHGEEALNIYRKEKESGRAFSAVIMDLTVPGGKGGRETIQEIMAFDPAVKGIVSSGYSNDPIMANFKQYGFRGCVAKPYRIQEISKILNQVLQS